jgi:hypothetical protein
MLYSSKSKRSPSEVWLALTARPHSLRGASPYRGVQKANSNPALPWRAALRFDGRTYNGGSYATQEEAALAWNQLALRIVGPEAQPRLNQIADTQAA